MKKNYPCLTFLVLFIIFYRPQLKAQEEWVPTNNYAGGTAAIDFANASAIIGLEYERIVYRKNNFEAGVRANWYKPYRSGNIDISISGGYISGYGGSYILSLYQGMATAYLYTSKRDENRGLFFSFAAGIIYSHAKEQNRSANSRPVYNDFLKGIEMGIGVNSSLAGNNSIRFALNGSLFDPQTTPANGESGPPLQLLIAKVSIGF